MKKGICQIAILFFLTIQVHLHAQTPDWRLFDTRNSPLTSIANDIKIAVDSSNNIWVGSGKDLIKHKNRIWTKYDTEFMHYGSLTDLIFDKKGTLFVSVAQAFTGDSNKRIFNYDGLNFQDHQFPVYTSDPYKLFVDSDNNLWASMINYWPHQLYQDHLGRLSGEKWQVFATVNLLDFAVYQKEPYVIWGPMGLYKLLGNHYERKIICSLSVSMAQSHLASSRDRIWIGGDSLFVVRDTNKIAIDTVNKFLKSNSTKITCFYVEKDSIIWMGTDNGYVLKYDQQFLKVFNFLDKYTTITKIVTDIEIDRDGNMWLGVKGLGIVQFNENKIVSVENKENEKLPDDFILNQNYPNPFNPSTTINFQIPNAGFISLKVFDILGNEISTLVHKYLPAGKYNSQFSINNMSAGSRCSQFASGVYFYQLKTGTNVLTKKMILIK